MQKLPYAYLGGFLVMIVYYLLLRMIWHFGFGLDHIGTFDEL